jgi:hypothetical protein
MNLFEQASRLKLHFDTVQGPLDVSDLWDLPVNTTVKNKASLADIARGLNKQLKDSGDDLPFLSAAKKADATVQLRFDIVKHIVETKTAEAAKAAEVRANADKKQQILALIATKEAEQLSGQSLDDLRKLAAEL